MSDTRLCNAICWSPQCLSLLSQADFLTRAGRSLVLRSGPLWRLEVFALSQLGGWAEVWSGRPQFQRECCTCLPTQGGVVSVLSPLGFEYEADSSEAISALSSKFCANSLAKVKFHEESLTTNQQRWLKGVGRKETCSP